VIIPLSETLLIAIVSSVGTGGVVWGLLRGDVTRTASDMRAVKKALGLEPTNGKIEAAFVPRGECLLREENAGKRLEACEQHLGDHEHRLAAVEKRVGAQFML
jgi:hypothetical protein